MARASQFGLVKRRIRDVLKSTPLPIPTVDLVALCGDGVTHPRALVHQALAGMLERGDVEKLIGKEHKPGRPVRWKWKF